MLGMTRHNPTTPVWREGEPGITRWDPWGDFAALRRQMDDWFDQVAGTPARLFGGDYAFVPPVDLYETVGEFVLLCYLPGMNQQEIQVEVTGDTVSISGERKSAIPEAEGITIHQIHGAYGRFNVAYTLPLPIQGDAVKATYENGVLELHLPKVEAARPKTVAVQIKEK